jgi:hypothetical protein
MPRANSTRGASEVIVADCRHLRALIPPEITGHLALAFT